MRRQSLETSSPKSTKKPRWSLDAATRRPVLETAIKKPTLKDLYKKVAKFAGPNDKKLTTSVPAELTRISPFEIESRRFMKERIFDKKVVYENSWGRVTLEGPRLSIYDEDILFILIHIMKGRGQLYFITSLHEICGIKKTVVRKNTANAIWESLKRITKTCVTIETNKDIDQNRVRAIFHLIDKASIREGDKKQIRVRINDYFYDLWGRDMITHIDLKKRLELRGDIAKALHRFLEGQSEFQTCGTKHLPLLTVAGALNLETEEMYTLRWQVKKAIGELVDKKYLMQSSGINRRDTVFFKRVSRWKPL